MCLILFYAKRETRFELVLHITTLQTILVTFATWLEYFQKLKNKELEFGKQSS